MSKGHIGWSPNYGKFREVVEKKKRKRIKKLKGKVEIDNVKRMDTVVTPKSKGDI